MLRAATDEETITETGRRAIDLEEYLGTLDDLERVVSGLLFSNNNGAAYRRLLAEIYRRLLPALYRAPRNRPRPPRTARVSRSTGCARCSSW